jgi:hypothetical protein
MITRLSAITAWLAAGHASVFALFWLLLSVPESNAVMLVASALGAAGVAFVFGLVEGGGLVAWDRAVSVRDVPRRALRALPGVWVGALLFVVCWYLVAHAAAWWQLHSGETDAWLMAQFGWSETAKLHAAARWVFAFASDVLGLSLALSLASSIVHGGMRQAIRPAWLRGACSPRRLATLTAILLVFLWLPWQGVNWRPSWLAPNWQETTFVVVKLGALFLVANVGWALVLGLTYLTSSHLRPALRWAA